MASLSPAARSLIRAAVGGGRCRGDVGRDEKAAGVVEDVAPGQGAAWHVDLLRCLRVDERDLGRSAVGGDGPEDVAPFRLLRQREAGWGPVSSRAFQRSLVFTGSFSGGCPLR